MRARSRITVVLLFLTSVKGFCIEGDVDPRCLHGLAQAREDAARKQQEAWHEEEAVRGTNRSKTKVLSFPSDRYYLRAHEQDVPEAFRNPPDGSFLVMSRDAEQGETVYDFQLFTPEPGGGYRITRQARLPNRYTLQSVTHTQTPPVTRERIIQINLEARLAKLREEFEISDADITRLEDTLKQHLVHVAPGRRSEVMSAYAVVMSPRAAKVATDGREALNLSPKELHSLFDGSAQLERTVDLDNRQQSLCLSLVDSVRTLRTAQIPIPAEKLKSLAGLD